MKLQMKNQLTFQEMSGYPDDPAPVSEEQVREQLKYWHNLLVEESPSLHGDLANLEAFLYNLAEGEIEYTSPANEYKYVAGYEYNKQISVVAYSQEEADRLAMQEFTEIATCSPLRIGYHDNTANLSFKYLERNEDHDFQRIFESN